MINKMLEKAIFEGREIRRVFHETEWWFSVVDVIAILTNSPSPSSYWRKLKQRMQAERNEPVTFCHGLKLPALDGKNRKTDCATIEGIFRIIQSVPSPKAEPFKRWLAKLGRERLEEIETPYLGIERARDVYEKKGYPKEWIEKRLQGVSVRKNLTDEWQNRGAKKGLDFAVLTNEIMQHTFGLKVGDYKEHKGLTKHDLRDHMTELELIITMLGEATTTTLTQDRNSEGIPELKQDAQEGGSVAGSARRDIESRTSKSVISQDNFIGTAKSLKLEEEV